jgi:hypothetical protein
MRADADGCAENILESTVSKVGGGLNLLGAGGPLYFLSVYNIAAYVAPIPVVIGTTENN